MLLQNVYLSLRFSISLWHISHYSAGIGRSGTFLALDYLADQAETEGYVNVFQCAQNLRHQRVNMIQNQVRPLRNRQSTLLTIKRPKHVDLIFVDCRSI